MARPMPSLMTAAEKEHERKSREYKSRAIKSCTHCRQQKIKCDAPARFPSPCSRCQKLGKECKVDPLFKPQKGGQMQTLREDLTHMKTQVDFLKEREAYLMSVIAKTHPNPASVILETKELPPPSLRASRSTASPNDMSEEDYSRDSYVYSGAATPTSSSSHHHPPSTNGGINSNGKHGIPDLESPSPSKKAKIMNNEPLSDIPRGLSEEPLDHNGSKYTLGDVSVSHDKADELHQRFVTNYLPFLPIIESASASELYSQSKILFWSVMLTASLTEPEPTLYNSLSDLVKKLTIEVCCMKTPRSTHAVQALLILCTWPLPNSKVLDDMSFRFVGIAKTVAMQLGMHRGKFIYEFSRTQTSLPDAEKWRTRTWLAIYLMEQVWSANLGLPSNVPVDYLVEKARTDESQPTRFRSLLCVSIFYSKMINLVGCSLNSPDGLIEARSRSSTLWILNLELDELSKTLSMDDPPVEIYYLYVKLMMCCFAFLPGMHREDQPRYVDMGFHTATRIVTLFSKLAEKRRIIEYPIYVRQAVSLSALVLFRLHLTPLLTPQFVDSARQSVVTVHRLFRNMLTAWKDFENDISRTAKVLEKLNFVIITHPYLLTQAPGIVTRMRSHLATSIFYELVWAIHEARRRSIHDKDKVSKEQVAALGGSREEGEDVDNIPQPLIGPNPPDRPQSETVHPLPFYNQITQDDFSINTTITPNGTSVTTLIPNHPNATMNAFSSTTSPVVQNSKIVTTANTAKSNSNIIPISSGSPTTNGSDMVYASNMNAYLSTPGLPGGGSSSPAPPPLTSSSDLTTAVATNNDIIPSTASVFSESNPFLGSTGASNDPLHLDTLMQGIDWMNGNGDDFLGWMDMTLSPSSG